MRFDAVVFDVDGTLYPNFWMYLASLPTFLGHWPLLKALEEVRIELRREPDLSDDFHRVQAKHLAKRLNVTPEHAFALVEARIYTKWYRIFRHLRPFPRLVDTLETFRVAGLRLAVLSDFPIRGRLRDLGLDGWWHQAFSSEETGYLKPHPQSFQIMAKKLEVAPSRTLYVGNSYRYDVLGARGAGMATAHLAQRATADSVADLTFQDYAVLRRFVLEPG